MHAESLNENTTAQSRIILGVDVANLEQARQLIQSTREVVGAVKIGKELFTACGPAAIALAKDAGMKVFLDLKYHDIPNTVAGAIRAAAHLNVQWISLHIAGGEEMLRAACRARDDIPLDRRPKLLGVTVLTSLPVGDPEEVVERALLAQRCGLDGAIASPLEVKRMRAACGKNFILVTPGVRPQGAALGDQTRVATPRSAVMDGADFLVVGRPIHSADQPVAAAQQIAKEISDGLKALADSVPEVATLQTRLLQMLRESGAFMDGHFVLTSGLHSDRYVQCARLMMQPLLARRAGMWLAEKMRSYEPDAVVSVAIGGLVIGQEVAAALDRPALFAERDASGKLQLRRGFALRPGSRVVIVDDVCTRGGSIKECATLLSQHGVEVVATGTIIDRSQGNRAFDHKYEALIEVNAKTFEPENCPACKAGVPTEKPGSRKDVSPTTT